MGLPQDLSGHGLGGQLESPIASVVANQLVPYPHMRPKKPLKPLEPELGSKAYKTPPPPRSGGGFNPDGSLVEGKVAECEREYTECWKVCRRFTNFHLKRKKNDCNYDCYREMRSCLWSAKPEWAKVREEFRTPEQKALAEKAASN